MKADFVDAMFARYGDSAQIRTEFHADALTATQESSNASSRELLDSVGNLLREAGVPETVSESGALHFLGRMIEAQAKGLTPPAGRGLFGRIRRIGE